MIIKAMQIAFAMAIVSAESLGFDCGGQQLGNRQMAHALRVVSADDSSPVGMSIREAYGQYIRPSLGGCARKTVAQFGTVIGLWERFCDVRGITSSNPAPITVNAVCPVDQVSQITDAMLDDFARWLMADIPARRPSHYSRSTVETYGKKLRTILKVLGPRESGNKRGANVLSFVPAMASVGDLAGGDRATGEQAASDAVDLGEDEIGRIYAACDIARWPDDVAALEWQVYVVVLAMLGPRVNDGATMRSVNFKFETKSPIKHSPRTHPHGWLDYVQEKTGKRVVVPLPAVVRAHVEALAKVRGHNRLFSWADSKSHAFADQWRAIVSQAGLAHVQRKHFRPTANLRWTLAAGDREVGAMVLGHAAADVNSKHYTRNEAILLEHVGKVACPPEFNVDPSRGPKQMFLF